MSNIKAIEIIKQGRIPMLNRPILPHIDNAKNNIFFNILRGL